MKLCKTCSTEKPKDDFGVHNIRNDGLQDKCRECKKSYNRKYYEANPNRESRRAGADRLRDKNREYVYNYLKNSQCLDCGNSDWRVLEFDHVDGRKEYNIGLIMGSRKLDTLKKEISKCEVRCRNCHILITQERSNSWRSWYPKA